MAEKPSPNPSNPIPSVWARQAAAADQPALSRAAIVREAIVMLDADGIEALSMRKLGARRTPAPPPSTGTSPPRTS